MSDDLVIELREKVLPHFQRFVDGYFNNPGTARPHVRIPSEPENDSDLIVSRGVKKAADRIEELEAEAQGAAAIIATERAEVMRLRDENARLREYAFEVSKALVGLTVGGSEFFTTDKRFGFYEADTQACVKNVNWRLEQQRKLGEARARAALQGEET